MITLEQVRKYALSLPHATEDMPFGEEHVVFRVGGKIFMIVSLDGDNYICVKCDPDRAIELRIQHQGIEPAFHMNKKHWNGIHCDSHLSRMVIEGEIKHSYDLVFAKLPAKVRAQLRPKG